MQVMELLKDTASSVLYVHYVAEQWTDFSLYKLMDGSSQFQGKDDIA